MIPIKICGITNVKDAMFSAKSGVSAIGMIFCKKSPRYVSMDKAIEISSKIHPSIARVGVFVDEDEENIKYLIKKIPLSMLQLHGSESPNYCMKFSIPVIKAFRIKDKNSLSSINDYKVYGYLFDKFSQHLFGGTGKTFDWSILNRDFKSPFILSGGLNPENIIKAVSTVHPAALDINSGVEKSPGVKDHEKIKSMISILKNIEVPNGFNFT